VALLRRCPPRAGATYHVGAGTLKLAIAISIFNSAELLEGLPQIEASGATAVEIGWSPFEEEDATLRLLRQQYAQAGVSIRSIHAPFGKAGDLAALDEAEREQALRAHENIIRRAHLVGATYIVIHPGAHLDDETLQTPMEEAARKSLARLVPVSEAEGVVLALENMLPHHPASDTEVLAAMVEEFASPALRVCFDTGHAHVGDGVMPVFRRLLPHIVTIHLTDNDTSHDQHLQAPYGTIDWSLFIPALEHSAYDEPVTIETRPWGGASPRRMVEEVTALFNSYAGNSGSQPLLPRLATNSSSSARALLRCPGCGHYLIETSEGLSCLCQHNQAS